MVRSHGVFVSAVVAVALAIAGCGDNNEIKGAAPMNESSIPPLAAEVLEPSRPATVEGQSFSLSDDAGLESMTPGPEAIESLPSFVNIPGNPSPEELARALEEQQKAQQSATPVRILTQVFVDPSSLEKRGAGAAYSKFVRVEMSRSADLPAGYVQTTLTSLKNADALVVTDSLLSGLVYNGETNAVWYSYDGKNFIKIVFQGQFTKDEIQRISSSLGVDYK